MASGGVILVSSPDRAQAVWTYYLGDTPPAAGTGIRSLWSGLDGILLFSNVRIDPAGAETVAAGLRRSLGVPVRSAAPWRMVAWVDDPAKPETATALYGSQSAPGVFSIRRTWSAAWGRFGIRIGASLTLRLEAEDGLPVIRLRAKPPDVGLVSFSVDDQPFRVGYSRDGFDMPIRLTGAGAGSLRIAVGIDPSVLVSAFRCGFAYDIAGAPLFLPMVPALSRTVDRFRAFDLWLNPIRPFDDVCTRFSVDDRGALAHPGFRPLQATADAPDPLAAPYFSTIAGDPVTLRPLDPGVGEPDAMAGGFAFSAAPGAAAPEAYLSPCGLWVPEDRTQPLRLMAGVSGTEFLLLGPGDRLLFRSHRPAAVPPLAEAAADAPRLGDAATTSWVVVRGSATSAPAYFGQPAASSFFGSPDGQPFPPALDVELAQFATDSPVFPLVPYGGVYAPVPADRHTLYAPPYDGPPETLLDLEAAVLAPIRHGLLAQDPRGPRFLPEGASAPDARLNRAVTPQGLLLNVEADGSASRLTLARSPGASGGEMEVLAFAAAPGDALPASLANVLTRDQAFLVVSALPSDMGSTTFLNRLHLAGFDLLFDVGAPDGTVLVFKFNTRASLKTLAAQPSRWSDAARFNDDPSAISARLVALIEEAASLGAADDAAPTATDAGAAPAGHARIDSFATFNALVDDETWTGVLAFDVQIDANDMPPGLQMLFGGITGDLRAHHLGVQANRVEAPSTPKTDAGAPEPPPAQPGPNLTLVESALFGVLHYDGPARADTTGSDPAYEVEHLRIAWSNSQIVQSDVNVGVTFPALFGRPVWLTDPSVPSSVPPNTLSIAGTSQMVDGIDTVTFTTHTPFRFDLQNPDGPAAVRVIQFVEITGASLVPVSSKRPSPTDPREVTLRLLMQGQVFFTPNPFPAGETGPSRGIDLFSYGSDAGEGLAIDGLTVEIVFSLDPVRGCMTPGSKTVKLHEEALVPLPKATALRPNSLLSSFPAQISAFLGVPAGIPSAFPHAMPLHVPQLESATPKPPDLKPADTKPADTKPADTRPSDAGPADAIPAADAGSPAAPVKAETAPAPRKAPPSTTAAPVWALDYDIHLGSLGALSDDHAGLAAKLLIGWGPSAAVPEDDAVGVLIVLPHLSGGVAGFSLEGLLTTKFGDGNLLRVDVEDGGGSYPVYVLSFSNVQLSLMGYALPQRTMADFTIFAGGTGPDRKASNLAWLLAARQADPTGQPASTTAKGTS